MSDPDIDFGLFDPRKLRKIVADIQDDPRLSRDALNQLDTDIAVRLAKVDAVANILKPLTDAYHKDRKRKDPKYDSQDDPVFARTEKVALGEMDRLLNEVDELRVVRSKVSNADIARRRFDACAVEFLKLMHLLRPQSRNPKTSGVEDRAVSSKPEG